VITTHVSFHYLLAALPELIHIDYLGLKIVGNSAGTAKEMDELLAMAVAGDVKAHVESYKLNDILEVLGRLERSEIEGRVVLEIPE